MMLVTLLAAAGLALSKEAIGELPTAAFIGSRFLLAALLLLPLAWLRDRPPSRSQLLRAAGCGTLLGASLLFWVTAISQSDALGSGAFHHERGHPDGTARRLGRPSRPDPAATTG